MSQKRHRAALADCVKGVAMLPAPEAKLLLRLARCHFNVGELAQAETALGRILDSNGADPTYAPAKHLRADVRRTQSYLDQFARDLKAQQWGAANMAISEAERSVSEIPPAWRLMRADVLLRRGDLDGANIAASDVLRRDQNDPDALLMRGRILCARGSEMEKAIKHAQAALRSDPENKGARALMKRCRKLEAAKVAANEAFKAGRHQEAVKL
jgi:DnaJ family protein C protein 7